MKKRQVNFYLSALIITLFGAAATLAIVRAATDIQPPSYEYAKGLP